MSGGEELTVRLSVDDIGLLIEALDSHEYWQLGDSLPRKNGFVFVPGDQDPDSLWEGVEPDAIQQSAIGEIERCRELATRLAATLDTRR